MVVMPAFTQRKQSKPQIVLRFFTSFISRLTEFMHDRVDGKCSMVQDHGAQKESNEQCRKPGCGEHGQNTSSIYNSAKCSHNNCQYHRRNEIILVQPYQLRI